MIQNTTPSMTYIIPAKLLLNMHNIFSTSRFSNNIITTMDVTYIMRKGGLIFNGSYIDKDDLISKTNSVLCCHDDPQSIKRIIKREMRQKRIQNKWNWTNDSQFVIQFAKHWRKHSEKTKLINNDV